MAPKEMKFALLMGKQHTEIRTRPIPPVGERQILIQQLACNICTADYGVWSGARGADFPVAGGHEGCGIVVEKGSLVRDLELGDLVAIGYDGCGECAACKKGDYLFCTGKASEFTEEGYSKGYFGFSDYSVKNARSVVKMNSELDPAEAAFLEPLATVVRGMKKLRAEPLETVVVIGAGTMGLLNALAARALGCRVIVSEIMPKKLAVARELGFEVIDANSTDPIEAVLKLTDGAGADSVIVAVGITAANNQALKMVKERDGKILYFAAGYPAPGWDADSNSVHYRRLDLVGTYGADYEDFLTAGKMLSDHIIEVSKLVEPQRFYLDDIQKAYELASMPGSYRVCVTLKKQM